MSVGEGSKTQRKDEMQHNQRKVVSLNVNGLNNPMKSGKVIVKLQKETSQETTLLDEG